MTAKAKVVVRKARSRHKGALTIPWHAEDIRAGAETVAAFRREAWARFQTLPWPTTKDEPWRRTDISGLELNTFRFPAASDLEGVPPAPKELTRPLVGDRHGGHLVLSPHGVERHMDPDLEAQGVLFVDLATAEQKHTELLMQVLGRVVRPEEGKFAALAAALARNGVFVYVPKGVEVTAPLHTLVWGPGARMAYIDHVVIWVDEGASLTYVHESASPTEDEPAFHAGIVEIVVADGASLRFVELQSWGEHMWHFTHERARVGRDASLDWVFGALGSHLTKNFTDVDLVAPGATARVSGFYFTDGVQHLDHDTQQNHLAPYTTSDLLYKGALKDRSRSVWQGMIYVAPGAVGTDGYQANRNLILSPHARADSIPGLEIKADDVRCTHGATVGKVDPEEMFYLRSRGIPEEEALRLIVEGFFDPIMQRIPFEGVRERFQQAITTKMG
ncbi:MAG TPA: Fe-S cluster assembly protein SufD [Anaerolineae bacterium]|nr:Fe-S cluster assembly protein SufD [Anaerolineae bacterium]HIQ08523.1 Fe-S cluster assembly protein SufD [Anaerolineaceae bacterium]